MKQKIALAMNRFMWGMHIEHGREIVYEFHWGLG
jgi:hypothetical protein